MSENNLHQTISYNVSLIKKDRREPCEYKAVGGSELFDYDPSKAVENCCANNVAWIYVSIWETEKPETSLPADLNNIACAYAWLNDPNWAEAKK